MIGLIGKEVDKGCQIYNDILVRDAGYLFGGKLVSGQEVFPFFNVLPFVTANMVEKKAVLLKDCQF